MYSSIIKLIEEKIDTPTKKLLAKTILRAQDIRELSWNDNKKEYDLSLSKACYAAVMETGIDVFWASIIVDFNDRYWNDIQFWCEDTLINEMME